jgi:hypothetical protein
MADEDPKKKPKKTLSEDDVKVVRKAPAGPRPGNDPDARGRGGAPPPDDHDA